MKKLVFVVIALAVIAWGFAFYGASMFVTPWSAPLAPDLETRSQAAAAAAGWNLQAWADPSPYYVDGRREANVHTCRRGFIRTNPNVDPAIRKMEYAINGTGWKFRVELDSLPERIGSGVWASCWSLGILQDTYLLKAQAEPVKWHIYSNGTYTDYDAWLVWANNAYGTEDVADASTHGLQMDVYMLGVADAVDCDAK